MNPRHVLRRRPWKAAALGLLFLGSACASSGLRSESAATSSPANVTPNPSTSRDVPQTTIGQTVLTRAIKEGRLARATSPARVPVTTPVEPTPGDTAKGFMASVLRDLDPRWSTWFAQAGLSEPSIGYDFVETGFVLPDACGDQDISTKTTVRAFYCPASDWILLPVDPMAKLLGGDASRTTTDAKRMMLGVAIVVAHEFGHSIHQELEVQGVPMTWTVASAENVGVELFADCLAGIWASTAYPDGYLGAGDIDAALDVISSAEGAPGTGSSTPHGTTKERVDAFALGYGKGVPYECMQAYIGTP